MRLFVLTALTMIAFAANSVLNRMALKGGLIDAFDFAAIRLGSGAIALCILALILGRRIPMVAKDRAVGAGSLLLYMVGFSFAYLAMDAGVGALILFGGVQVTMFLGALLLGEPIPLRRWIGAGLAAFGLAWLLWPGPEARLEWGPVLAMAAAAIGWGIYSLAGRRGGDPLASTAANFLLATPVALALVLFGRSGDVATPAGISLALVSGVVTSGFGYALWYRVLPQLDAARAGVAQLSVPVIAVIGGMAFLAEPLTLRLAVAVILVLGGVFLATLPARRAG